MTHQRGGVRLIGLARQWSGDRRAQFWTFQLAGWSGLCVVTFLSLTLWYNSIEAIYVQHTLLQAVLGLLISLFMRWAFRAIWHARALPRLLLSATVIVLASLAWTALRIETFMAMTGEAGVWTDFGGWYFASLLVMLSWALAYHGVRYYRLMVAERERAVGAQVAASRERLRRVTAESAARDAQLQMLRYQVNPHFLFNTLNSVSALVETGRSGPATEMIGELSGFLRATLRGDTPIRTSLREEIETLRLYLAIEQKRFGDRLNVTFDVAPSARTAALPSLLLQPLVENSIKYAVARTRSPTMISVKARRADGRLHVEVSDDGAADPARPSAKVERGLGLSNVRDRLETEFAGDYDLSSCEEDGGGWRTTIEVPFVEEITGGVEQGGREERTLPVRERTCQLDR